MRVSRRPLLPLLALVSLCAASRLSAQEVDAGVDVDVGSDADSDLLPDRALTSLAAIEIREIRVEGSTVFSDDELATATAPYENRAVSFEELEALRHALSQEYVARGYVNSGLVIPDQRVDDGVVTLQAVEGELTDVAVEGNRRLAERSIARRVAHDLGTPLNINELQSKLRTLQDDPLIQRVDAQLMPGDSPGQSHLRLGVVEERPLVLDLAAANDRSASVGEDRATASLTYRGLIGNGDALSVGVGLTDGLRDNVLSYRVPVTLGGTALAVAGSEQDADIVERPFDTLDITSHLTSWSLTATRPFVREADRSVTGIIAFETKRSESVLLGLPFSFSPGDVDGKARGSSVTLGAELTRSRAAHAWAARASFQVGVDALDATVSPTGPDSEFVVFLGQFQYVKSLPWRASRIVVRNTLQLARDPLLAMYKLPVGGRYSVRGYRENRFVRDNGAVVSVEYQFPALLDDTGRPRDKFVIALFSDFGTSWDEDEALPTSRREHIASIGTGLLWTPIPGLQTELYFGYALEEQDVPKDSLQDRGIHYGLRFQRPF